MRVLGYLLVGCVACAALQAAVTALALAIIVGLIVGLLTRPAETLGFVTVVILADLFKAQPLACFGVWALVVANGRLPRTQ